MKSDTTLRRRAWRWGIAMLALSLGAEFFVAKETHFAPEALPFFHAAFGFLACAAIVALAKALGRFLERRDDYYDGGSA